MSETTPPFTAVRDDQANGLLDTLCTLVKHHCDRGTKSTFLDDALSVAQAALGASGGAARAVAAATAVVKLIDKALVQEEQELAQKQKQLEAPKPPTPKPEAKPEPPAKK